MYTVYGEQGTFVNGSEDDFNLWSQINYTIPVCTLDEKILLMKWCNVMKAWGVGAIFWEMKWDAIITYAVGQSGIFNQNIHPNRNLMKYRNKRVY